MSNKNLIFITGPVGCGKTLNGEKFQQVYGCELVIDGANKGEIQHALNTRKGPFLVLTAAPEEVLAELFPESRVIHYMEACKAAGISPFHLPDGRLNPAILGAAPKVERGTGVWVKDEAASAAYEKQVADELGDYGHDLRVLNEIKTEREKQRGKGFDSSHDDRYTDNELPQAAIAYALNAALPQAHVDCPFFWPWAVQCFKPEGRRADMIKAAALLVAEIERMDRAIAAKTTGTIDGWEPGDDDLQLARDAENEGDL